MDVITNGKSLYIVRKSGSKKRSGGQGDILCGIISSLTTMSTKNKEIKENKDETLLISIAASCFITKYAALIGFEKKHISFTAVDLIEEITQAFKELNYTKF